MPCSVIIPTYRKKNLLFQNLRNNLPYLKKCEVIVVNDYPQESIRAEMEKQFPSVYLIERKVNGGFGAAVHTGISHASHPFILLLNSDVQLHDTSYEKAFKHFADDASLFGVSFALKERDGSIVGKNKIFWKKGFILHEKADDLTYGPNGWAEGGACLLDRKKYLALGGFDMIYAPFYWEDIDLSYRAWKAGYRVIFDPAIQVTHHHESTIGTLFQQEYVKTIAYRNQFLCVWRNIHDFRLILHILWLLPHSISMIRRGEWSFFKGFFQAMVRSLLIAA